MDKLVATEKENKKVVIHQQSLFDHEKTIQKAVAEKTQEEKAENIAIKPVVSSYANSFENLTVADIKREQERKKAEEFAKEKEELLEKAYEPVAEEKLDTKEKSVSDAATIDKPNYDLIDTNRKIVRLHKNQKTPKPKKGKKHVGLALAIGLGISGVICVTNAVLIDQLSTNFVQIEQSYNINLATYLKNIANIDSAKKGLDFLETYPEDVLPPGDAGKTSNWFDRLCNFIAGLFGG